MIKPFTAEEEKALSEAPESRLTDKELYEMLDDLEQSRRLRNHLDRGWRVAELQREKKEGF